MKDKKIRVLREKGITLIALVVTIIILLILAGVTLNMALSGDGLFSRARNAADKYKKAQEDEAELISEIGKEMNSEYVGASVIGYEPDKKTEESEYTVEASKSGTNENQKFTTEEMEWKIWDYDGTVLRLISDKPTAQTLTLEGAAGYNNGVYIINEICRQCYGQYGEDGKMKQGISVANLKRSDVEKVNTYDYTTYKHKLDSSADATEEEEGIKFGETRPFTENNKYPSIWENDRKWNYNKNEGYILWEREFGDDNGNQVLGGVSEEIEFKQSIYNHTFLRNEFKNEKYYDLIGSMGKGVGLVWLASRWTYLFENEVHFGISTLSFPGLYVPAIGGHNLFSSRGNDDSSRRTLRPMISIDLKASGYSLVKNEDVEIDAEYILK